MQKTHLWRQCGTPCSLSDLFDNEKIATLMLYYPLLFRGAVRHSESKILITESKKWADLDPKKMPNLVAAINIDDRSLLYTENEELKKAFDELDERFKQAYPKGVQQNNLHLAYDKLDELASLRKVVVVAIHSDVFGGRSSIIDTARGCKCNYK
jgi:hypothetical protein